MVTRGFDHGDEPRQFAANWEVSSSKKGILFLGWTLQSILWLDFSFAGFLLKVVLGTWTSF